MAGNFLMEHNFSPRWSSQHQRTGSHGQHTDSPPEGNGSGGSHHRFSLDSLAHFVHAFNTSSHSATTHPEAKVHPLFDLVESHDDFKIYGELPGMTSDDVHLDVNDHLFTITVSGKFEVPGEIAALQAAAPGGEVPVTHRDAATKKPEEKKPDEGAEEAVATGEASAAAAAAATGKEEAKEEAQEAKKEEEQPEAEAEHPKFKYHIHERKLGSFKRAFQFPVELVRMADVTARCKNGLLTITVPKNPKPVERKGRKLDVV